MVLKQLGTFVAVLTICAAPGFGLDKVADRLEAATSVVGQILDMPDGIPQELLDKAECIVVLPSVKKFAIGFGGSYGRGPLICRSGKNFTGSWGAPGRSASKAGISAFSSADKRRTSSSSS